MRLGPGFRAPESWGVWTRAPRARLTLALPEPVAALKLELQFICGALLRGTPGLGVTVAVNGGAPQGLLAAADVPDDKRAMSRTIAATLPAPADVITLEIGFAGDPPLVAEQGWQQMGLGLTGLRCWYG